MNSVQQRLADAGVILPAAPRPVAAYVPSVQAGDLVFVSGQLPLRDGALTATGPVPSEVTVEAASAAARQCVINALAVLINNWRASSFVTCQKIAESFPASSTRCRNSFSGCT